MAEIVKSGVSWRIIGWGGAVSLLAAPFVAMQLGTLGVRWTLGDFIVAGILLGLVGGGFEVATRMSRNWSYRSAAALALLGTLLTIWSNLAVGIVGSEDNPANMWFFAALIVGFIASCVSRFRARGMSIAMLLTAGALWAAFAIASISPTDERSVSLGVELAGSSMFALLFLASAALFRKAARDSGMA